MRDCISVPIIDTSHQAGTVNSCDNDVLKKIYQEISPKVVKVNSQKEGGSAVAGSGFFVGNGDEVVTNLHVIRASKLLPTVTLESGQVYPAYITTVDDLHDLALLRVVGLPADSSRAIKFSSTPIRSSEQLFALGHPQGIDKVYVSPGVFTKVGSYTDFEPFRTVIPPYLSDPRNKEIAADLKTFFSAPHIVSTAKTEKGNSGGPLVNARGELEAVVVASVNPTPGVPKNDLALATSVSNVRDLLNPKIDKFVFSYGWETLCSTRQRRSCSSVVTLQGIKRTDESDPQRASRLPLLWNRDK